MRAAVCVAACVLLLAVCASAMRSLAHIDRTEIQAMLEAEANTQVMTEAQVREQAALHAETMAALEEEGRIEVAMWTHHMEQEHDPACVAQIFPVCRSHRDWCRQDCDNKSQTDSRCMSSKCTSLFRQCHNSHVDRCEKGSAYGVHPVWKDTAKSSKKYCEVKIQEKCGAVKEVCNRKCDAPGQSCSHDKCTKIHTACQNMHKNSCGDPLWITPRLPHHQENSKEFQKKPKSESSESGSESSSKQKWGSESAEPKLSVKAKDVSSDVTKKVDGYIACEETVAKRCEVETKQCVRTCAAQNADPSLGKCDPEKCYRMHEQCSDKYSLECESPKAKAVDAEELPAGQHFCKAEDPACGSIRPDIVHKLNCTLENDFCLNVAKSHVSSCDECEQRKLNCYNSCRDGVIKFASNSPTTKGRCTARRCMEEFNLCHELRCEAKKADLVEAEEIPEGSTAKSRMVEQLRRERDAEAFFKSEQKRTIEAGVCGDGVRQPGEECDGGAGCDLRCLCGVGFKKKKDGTDCVQAGPAPCSFLKSGCLYGQGQTNPTIVPHGSLFNYDQGEIVVRAAPQQY